MKQPRLNQLIRLYQKSWSKVEQAKALQNKHRKDNKELSDAYGDKAAYYAVQWLHLSKIVTKMG